MGKTQTKKNRTHKGGRFIDKGGFGCTFAYPPLPCWDPRGGPAIRGSSDKISKMMYDSTAQQAILKNRMFRNIDPAQKYFISTSDDPADRCRPDLRAVDPSDQIDKCHLDQNKTLELLMFQYGGTSLRKLTLTAKEYAPFFKSLWNIFDGMTLAHTNNILHHDIKPDNIVTQPLPSGEFQTRIIDFDLATDLNHAVKGSLGHLDSKYLFYPFDTIFANPAAIKHFFPKGYLSIYQIEHQKNLLRQELSQWYGQFSPEYVRGFVLGDGQPITETRHMQIGATAYISTYMPLLSSIPKKYTNFLKSVDVYMVGYTLGLMLNKFFSCLMICEDKVTAKYKITFKMVTPPTQKYIYSNELVANGFTQEAENWFSTVESWVLIPYAQLVEEMTTWNFTKRLTMEEARYRYGQLLLSMEMLFTEDAITRFLVPLGAVTLKAQPVLPDVPSPLDKIKVSPTLPNVERAYQIPPTNLRKIKVSPASQNVERAYQIPPTNLRKIEVSPASQNVERAYQIPTTNLRKIATDLFEGGKRRRKTQKKRGRK